MNHVHAAMRCYLGAVGFRSRAKDQGETEKPDLEPRPKG
jgi:hypothetical protein